VVSDGMVECFGKPIWIAGGTIIAASASVSLEQFVSRADWTRR
jgi:hypothetical protein